MQGPFPSNLQVALSLNFEHEKAQAEYYSTLKVTPDSVERGRLLNNLTMNDFFHFYEQNQQQDPEFLQSHIDQFCGKLETAIFFLEGRLTRITLERQTRTDRIIQTVL
jgi:hypothetical protein